MARIYYHEEKLCGQAFESEIINIKSFNHIFENTFVNYKKCNFESSIKSSFWGLIKSVEEKFKIATISKVGYSYKGTYDEGERNVYIPDCIIFYDVEDYNFPSEFYLIAKIQNQIEIRICNGGNNVEWFQIPELHKPLTNPKIISKIENTFLELIRVVDKDYKTEKIKQEKEQKEREEREQIERDRPYLNDIQKKAYLELTELCVFNNKNRKKILSFIKTLKNYDNDSNYYTTLNYFMDFLDENEFGFIMRMDWKAEIETLEWLLSSTIKENHNINITLPNPRNFNDDSTVSEVFEDYDKPLRENGLQLGFIDTQSDEYIVILHKIQDKEKVEQSIKEIGYDYYEK